MTLSELPLDTRVVAFMVVLGGLARPVLANEVHKAESKAELTADGSAGRITNRTLEVISDHAERRRLLLQKEVQETFQDNEPGSGQVRIEAWRLPRSLTSRPVYSISEPGAEIGWLFYPDLLKVRTRACCDSSGSYTIFNAATGKMLVYANGGSDKSSRLLTVVKDGRMMLLVGVLDEHGGRRPAIFPEHGDGIPLLVTTADSASCRRQLLFKFPSPPNKMASYLTSVGWERQKTGRLSGLEIDLAGKDQLDALLKVVLSGDRTLLLPVSDEGIDPAKVVPPKGVTMTVVSPCKL